jgi:hypothetical protein
VNKRDEVEAEDAGEVEDEELSDEEREAEAAAFDASLDLTCADCKRPIPPDTRIRYRSYHACMRCGSLLHWTCGTNDNPWRYDLCKDCNDAVVAVGHNPWHQVGRADRHGLRKMEWE